MEREELLGLLAQAPQSLVVCLADRILADSATHGTTPLRVVKPPTVGLLLVQARDTVAGQRFYLGNVVVTEARVEFGGQSGYGLVQGRDKARALAVAVLDAALANGHRMASEIEGLLIQVKEQLAAARLGRWKRVAPTRVRFEEVGE